MVFTESHQGCWWTDSPSPEGSAGPRAVAGGFLTCLPPHLSGRTGKPPGSFWTVKHGQMAQEVQARHDHSSPSPASSLLMEVTLKAGHPHERPEGLLRVRSRASHQLLGPGSLHADDSPGDAAPQGAAPRENREASPSYAQGTQGSHPPTQGPCGVDSPEPAGGAGQADRQAGRAGPWAPLACSLGDTVWKNLQNQGFSNR